MRKSLGVQPRIYPEPVLIIAAYDENGTPQCMNAAWGGLCASDKIMMSVNPAHATVAALRSAGAFSVSMGQADQVVACDYVGITSGNNVADKFARRSSTSLPTLLTARSKATTRKATSSSARSATSALTNAFSLLRARSMFRRWRRCPLIRTRKNITKSRKPSLTRAAWAKRCSEQRVDFRWSLENFQALFYGRWQMRAGC